MTSASTDRDSGRTAVDEPVADAQRVTAAGEAVVDLIEGVAVRRAVTHLDERGELVETYDPRWGLSAAPMVYNYLATIRPGIVKGWVRHAAQDDRLFFAFGTVKVVLYDDRKGSRTRGRLNDLCFGERDRATLVIPRGVWHALHNVGAGDVVFLNTPTRGYDHERPDKVRLPLDNDVIPYRFATRR
jgi:dTDP-4-dehydrorhamnose 3,5-epimerase